MRTLLLLVGVAGCAHNVNQDVASGPDAKIAGAKTLKIAATNVKETGIVTYPGGDRVDWKAIELPTGKHGRLDFTLTYTTPRPGLHVSFDLFDRYQGKFDDIAANYKTAKRTRTASLKDVSEKVFVRVYAPKRGDAGKYTLVANFVEAPPTIDLSKVNLPGPPPLADVELACTPDNFDKNKPGCRDVCPNANPPRHWAPCEKTCDGRDDPEIKACADTMPCENRNNPKIRACAISMACPSPPDSRVVACNKPIPPPPPIYGRINKVEVSGGESLITVAVTSDQKIEASWPGTLLHGDSDSPLANGTITITSVEKRVVKARVKLPVDIVNKNLRVRIQGPTPLRPAP